MTQQAALTKFRCECGRLLLVEGQVIGKAHGVEAGDRALETARKLHKELNVCYSQERFDQLAALIQSAMNAQERESFWVVERFEDGKSAGYWDGANSRSFQFDIVKAIQFRRKEDAFWATRGWHWKDVQITEHMMMAERLLAERGGTI